jgi:hypothetical protein
MESFRTAKGRTLECHERYLGHAMFFAIRKGYAEIQIISFGLLLFRKYWTIVVVLI